MGEWLWFYALDIALREAEKRRARREQGIMRGAASR
jgi:hypothetical protein